MIDSVACSSGNTIPHLFFYSCFKTRTSFCPESKHSFRTWHTGLSIKGYMLRMSLDRLFFEDSFVWGSSEARQTKAMTFSMLDTLEDFPALAQVRYGFVGFFACVGLVAVFHFVWAFFSNKNYAIIQEPEDVWVINSLCSSDSLAPSLITMLILI